MSVYSLAAIQTEINAYINTNGTGAITGAVGNMVMQDIAESSYNRITHANIVGLKMHDPAAVYGDGQTLLYNGKFATARRAVVSGAYDLADFRSGNLGPIGTQVFLYAAYDPLTSYVAGQIIRYEYGLYYCDVNAGPGVLPSNTGFWSELYSNNNTFGNAYQSGVYAENDVILNPADGFLYKCVEPSVLLSIDFATELGAGQWVLVGGGGSVATPNLAAVLAAGNSTGGLNMTSPDGKSLAYIIDGGNEFSYISGPFQATLSTNISSAALSWANSSTGKNGTVQSYVTETLVQHTDKIKFNAPVYNFNQATASYIPFINSSKNMVASYFSQDADSVFIANGKNLRSPVGGDYTYIEFGYGDGLFAGYQGTEYGYTGSDADMTYVDHSVQVTLTAPTIMASCTDFGFSFTSPNRVLITHPSTGYVTTSVVTAGELQYVSGVTSPLQAQIDALTSGLYWKAAVRAATTANITLSGTQTIDTVVLVVGDRVLVKNQSVASENGIYVVAAGAWTRATDFDNTTDRIAGATMAIEEGSQGDKQWVCTTDNPIVVGTTNLTFALVGGSTYTGTTNRIDVTGNVIDIASTYIGQNTITTLGTIGAGVWNGTSISTTYTDAKIKTVTGTASRLAITGTSTDPIFDISSAYVGQGSITTVGTLTSGTIGAGFTAIADARLAGVYIYADGSRALTADWNVGAFNLTAKSYSVSGTAGAGYLALIKQSSAPSTPANGIRFFADSTGRLAWVGENGFTRMFDGLAITASRTYTLQDQSGTVALLSDIPAGTTELAPAIAQQNSPPGSPTTGDRYVVGTVPTGAWVGFATQVAQWTGSAWSYTVPVTSNTIYLTGTLATIRFNGTAWVSYSGTALIHNGNSLGLDMVLGTNDAFGLSIKTNNVVRATLNTTGNWSFTGGIGLGGAAAPTTNNLSIPASTTSKAHLFLAAGVDYTGSMTNGLLWYNGSNLKFRDAAISKSFVFDNDSRGIAKSASFTVAATENGVTYNVTTGTNVITATYPTGVAGFVFYVRKVDSGTGIVITSVASTTLTRQNQLIQYAYNGSTWDASVLDEGYMPINTIMGNLTGAVDYAAEISSVDIHDTTQKAYNYDQNGFTKDWLSGVFFSQHKAKTVTGTSKVTILSTTAGDYVGAAASPLSVPAFSITPGKALRFKLRGFVTTTVASDTLLIEVTLGGTTFTSATPTTITSTVTAAYFEIDYTIQFSDTGSSGTAIGTGILRIMTAAGVSTSYALVKNTTYETLDTTVANTLDVKVQHSTGANSITNANATFERLA